MWNLPTPSNSNVIEELNTALTYKNGKPKHALTKAETSEIEALYEFYDYISGVANNVLKGENINFESRKAIYNAYSEVQEGHRLEELRSRLLLAVDKCPYCGISEADELDHHLPRSIYEVLSVYARNLVPICHKCNNKKRAITGENPKERFTHVYFTEIPEDICFFKAQVNMVNDSLIVNFEIDKSANLSNVVYDQLCFQVERINLNKRLQKEVNDFLFSFAVNIQDMYESQNSSKAISQLLLKNSNFFNRKYGLNNWRTAFLIALSNCEEFCNGGFKKIF
ncbi:HNH endonuclease [Carboxylicivirga marina]|uniref:HNH endonuclease n=1 Tax=Carboxylicivirga marina TaxID=2800988 RepID=UPI002599E685|nr:HNH endonuclease signature motif containing protein [uncultured Carboxylicivirga sp.]